MKIIFDDQTMKIACLYKDKKVGYLKFTYPKDISGKRNITIEYIYVNPRFRRKKMATRMIEFFLKKFSGVVWVSLWTGKQMEINKFYGLFKKLGFKQIAFQADYYEDGIGTRLFVKKLN